MVRIRRKRLSVACILCTLPMHRVWRGSLARIELSKSAHRYAWKRTLPINRWALAITFRRRCTVGIIVSNPLLFFGVAAAAMPVQTETPMQRRIEIQLFLNEFIFRQKSLGLHCRTNCWSDIFILHQRFPAICSTIFPRLCIGNYNWHKYRRSGYKFCLLLGNPCTINIFFFLARYSSLKYW